MAELTGISFSDLDAMAVGQHSFTQSMTDGPVYFEGGDEFGDEILRDEDGRLENNTGVAHYRMEIGFLTVSAPLAGAPMEGHGLGGAVIQTVQGVQMNGNQTIAEYQRFKYPATMYDGLNPDPELDAALKAGDYSVWSEWIKIG